ncbi:MAG: rhamnogalacturonan acetylesterase [Dysgonamonadaceae bacterium]|jgi:lysophospholipase L1-like esterase|nr:rhamnogalacturonan acetylesterase [Dysgonamonadaceae bacterium]
MKRKLIFAILLLFLSPLGDLFSKSEEASEAVTNIVVYLIGDSTCANKSESKRPETGWGEKLQQFLDRHYITVDNRAIDGRSSKSFIAEGRWDNILTTLKTGDWVFIQFGHNDQYKGEANEVWSTVDEYKTNLRRYVNETRAKGANPVILTSIVRRQFSGNELTQSLGEYPGAARAIAAEMSVPLIDMEAKTRAVVSALGPEDSKSLYMWVNLDNTHLNPAGAETFASLVVEGIRENSLTALTDYIVDPTLVDGTTLYEWNFANDSLTFPTASPFTANATTVNGLTFKFKDDDSPATNFGIISYSPRTYDGTVYHRSMLLGGDSYWNAEINPASPKPNQRYLYFDVPGDCTVKMLIASTSSYAISPVIYLTDGKTDGTAFIDSIAGPAGRNAAAIEGSVRYTGEAARLYVGGKVLSGGVRPEFYYIKVLSPAMSSGVPRINAVLEGKIISVAYYDLTGRQVIPEAKGLLLRRIVYEGGRVETGKIWIRP